jgi:Rod binding domain-containing protein
MSSVNGTAAQGFAAAPAGPAGERPGRAGNGSPAKIEETAHQFEALLIAQLIRSARQAGTDGWMGTGDDQAASSALELAEEQFAQALAAQGGLGLAGLVRSGLMPPPGGAAQE